MALVHEFLQITQQDGLKLRSDDFAVPYDRCQNPPTGFRVFRLKDDVVLRSIGCGRYFSGFTGMTGGMWHEGLNYWGVTLLDGRALCALTAPVGQAGRIAPGDRYEIARFRRFCDDTLKRVMWLVHFGV